jgi:hypothetical protein
MITEQSQSLVLPINGTNAKTLDFSEDVNDPSVMLFGMGSVRLSTLTKQIKADLNNFGNMIGRKDAKSLMVYLTDFQGKYSSGMYFAYRMQALMEVEEFMKRPEVKRKIALIKKQKQGG